MTDEEILRLAAEMRKTQKEFFRNKDRDVLNRSKVLEKSLDIALSTRLSPQKEML